MDIVDEAQSQVDLDLSISLAKRKTELISNGNCHNCQETINSGLFCDTDCRNDFEKRKIMRGIYE